MSEQWIKMMDAYHRAVAERDRQITTAVLEGETYGLVGQRFQGVKPSYGAIGPSATKKIMLRYVHRMAREGEEPYVELAQILPMITHRKRSRVELNRAGHRVDAIERARKVWERWRKARPVTDETDEDVRQRMEDEDAAHDECGEQDAAHDECGEQDAAQALRFRARDMTEKPATNLIDDGSPTVWQKILEGKS